jgi:UDP-2,3-diacylglucosamine hydrolase
MSVLYLVGDAHLGCEGAKKENIKVRSLLDFFSYIQQPGNHLVIMGDLFDFWFEYRYALPKQHFEVLAGLRDLVNSGVQIDYLAGNHDFWLDSFIGHNIGVNVHMDDMQLQWERFALYLRHGDGLLKSDHFYRILKKVLRNRFNVFLYRLLHPDAGIPLAHFFSRLSRNSSSQMRAYSDDDYRAFARNKLKENIDMVVLGHTHWAACKAYQGGWYLNPGAWMLARTFIQVDKNGPQLFQWNPDGVTGFKTSIPPGNKGEE